MDPPYVHTSLSSTVSEPRFVRYFHFSVLYQPTLFEQILYKGWSTSNQLLSRSQAQQLDGADDSSTIFRRPTMNIRVRGRQMGEDGAEEGNNIVHRVREAETPVFHPGLYYSLHIELNIG